MRTRAPSGLATIALLLAACGPTLPRRHVIERDVGDYAYRRYQRVLDVELRLPDNDAVGHTATYVRRRADAVTTANAFVTVYERPRGLAAEVRDAVEGLGTYEAEIVERDGHHVWRLDGGGDRWLLWVSGRRVVKLGAPDGEDDVPEALYEAYLSLYPSDLDERGRAREGTASAGRPRPAAPPEAARPDDEDDEDSLPPHLRQGAPQ